MVPLRTCARRSGPNQYPMAPSFSCATAPSFHVRRAPGLSQCATSPPSRSDEPFTQCAIAPPPSCGISFPCATAFVFHAQRCRPRLRRGFHSLCLHPRVEYPFHVRQHSSFHARRRRLLSSDGPFTECAIAPLCSRTPAVSFIVRDGGLLPSVTVPFISCAFFPHATVPSSRVQRKSSCVHHSTLPLRA
jgi:hypothetical protein